MAEKVLEVNNVCVDYSDGGVLRKGKGRRAVNNVSFYLEKGEILGRNEFCGTARAVAKFAIKVANRGDFGVNFGKFFRGLRHSDSLKFICCR